MEWSMTLITRRHRQQQHHYHPSSIGCTPIFQSTWHCWQDAESTKHQHQQHHCLLCDSSAAEQQQREGEAVDGNVVDYKHGRNSLSLLLTPYNLAFLILNLISKHIYPQGCQVRSLYS